MSSGESRWGKPPPGYIPGLGRGAVGIQTRSDLGPARNITNELNVRTKDSQTQGGTMSTSTQENESELRDLSETKFNKWNGYEENLFSNTEYDEEDRDADFQYNMVDDYMDERRKSRKQKKEMEFLMKFRRERPTIKQTFSDLKSDLKKLKKDDWENIPEIADYTVKKRKIERYTPNTDTNIERALNENQIVNAIDPININKLDENQSRSPTEDILNDLGKAKNSVLSVIFDKMSDKVSGMNSVNPIGYLTEMSSVIKINSQNEVQDFKKARTILKSILNTDSKNVGGWIAACRLEELDGKISQARNIIAQAAQNILDSEDIWLEAARIHPPEEAKLILAKGISHLPNSKKLWLTAADMEVIPAKKSKILRKALENLPANDEIWKRTIELENEDEAKLLLYRAVECIPSNVDMWLALARLETFNKAKSILNKARMAIPDNHSIWVHASKLEEANNFKNCKVDELIERGIKTLAKNGKIISREVWHEEAENCEIAGSLKTCSAIIKSAIKSDSTQERSQIWIELAELSKNKGCIETLRFIYDNLILTSDDDIFDLWMTRISIERTFGNNLSVGKVLSKAVESYSENENNEILWLMYAKHKWQTESIEAGKLLLINALEKHPNNEQIILAMVKLEKEDNNYEAAKKILSDQRANNISSAKVWMQSVQILREERKYEEAFELCEEAIGKFPEFSKLWMISAQIKEEIASNSNNDDELLSLLQSAVKIYENGIEKIKKNPYLYICLERLLKNKLNKEGPARRVMEMALKALPKDEKIWCEFVRFEINCKNYSNAGFILSRGLKELPNSGVLWSLAIDNEKPQNKHSKAVDALSKIEHNEFVMTSIAKIYYLERNIEKARKWFENSIRVNPDNGDIWAYYYKCELDIGDKAEEIILRCHKAAPKHGEIWTTISKKVENWKLKIGDILMKVSELINF